MCGELRKHDVNPSLFSVNSILPVDWTRLLESARRTKRLVVLDDSKSVNGSYLHLLVAAQQEIKLQRLVVLTRKRDDAGLRPNADQFVVDHKEVLAQLGFDAIADKATPPEVSARVGLEKISV